MACFTGAIPTMGGVNYTVPVPVLKSSLVYRNQQVKIINCNTSDIRILNGSSDVLGNHTCTIQLRDKDKQKWSDNTTTDKTYTYQVIHEYGFSSPYLTDALMKQVVQAADLGEIDLYEDYGWRVGDKRPIDLSAVTGQSALSTNLVLLHRGDIRLTTPVKNKDKTTRNNCSFVVGLETVLNNAMVLNSTASGSVTWANCGLRTFLNGTFKGMFNSDVLACFKSFVTKYPTDYTAESTVSTCNDTFAIPAIKQVFNAAAHNNAREVDALSNELVRFTYFETAANIPPVPASSSDFVWLISQTRGDSRGVFNSILNRAGSYTGATSPAKVYPYGVF